MLWPWHFIAPDARALYRSEMLSLHLSLLYCTGPAPGASRKLAAFATIGTIFLLLSITPLYLFLSLKLAQGLMLLLLKNNHDLAIKQ